MLEKIFQLKSNNTTASREVLAGLTTLVTMAYIVIVAPSMLHQAGMPHASAFLSVTIIVVVSTLLNGFIANLPFGLAPGLGLLSYFSYVLVQQQGVSWSVALGAVVIAGLLFFLVTITKLRRLILKGIPHSLGCAVAAGLGFFIGFIALKNVGVVVTNPNTIITLGHVQAWPVLLFFMGFMIIAVLDSKKIPGAILIGMLVISIIGFMTGIAPFHGLVALPPMHSEAIGAFALQPWLNWHAFPVIFTFFIIALFDSTGAVLGLTHAMGRERKDPQTLKQMNRSFVSESIATLFSGVMGSTTICMFVESSAGIRTGGRTGLTSIVIALGFLVLLFFSPLANSIPTYATSAALFYVCCMMVRPFAQVEWADPSEYIPAVITLLMIPLTFSIADGVGLGVLCYIFLKTASGKWRVVHPIMWLLGIIFIAYFLST